MDILRLNAELLRVPAILGGIYRGLEGFKAISRSDTGS
jgi:hypothetical protein